MKEEVCGVKICCDCDVDTKSEEKAELWRGIMVNGLEDFCSNSGERSGWSEGGVGNRRFEELWQIQQCYNLMVTCPDAEKEIEVSTMSPISPVFGQLDRK